MISLRRQKYEIKLNRRNTHLFLEIQKSSTHSLHTDGAMMAVGELTEPQEARIIHGSLC